MNRHLNRTPIALLAAILTSGMARGLACASLKQKHSKQTRQLHTEQTAQQNLRFTLGTQHILIRPKGNFHFGPDSGFSGQAHYVLLQTQHRSLDHQAASRQTTQDHTHNQQLHQQLRQPQTRNSVTTRLRQVGNILLLIAGLILVYRLYRAYRRWR